MRSLAWLQWHHPNMPWDGTELCVARFNADGSLGPAAIVAGGAAESIFQPEWSPDGTLYFVSDRIGLVESLSALARRQSSRSVHAMAAEFGKPQWTFSMVTYAFVTADRIAATYTQDGPLEAGVDRHRGPGRSRRSTCRCSRSSRFTRRAKAIYFVGGSATEATAVIKLAVDDRSTRRCCDRRRPSGSIRRGSRCPKRSPTPRPGATCTRSTIRRPIPRWSAPAGERPPLLVLTHGGPTGATSDVLDPKIQFWTSRGFAVLDVNYSGSTGYGRAYRERLNGQWGIADVDDVVGGAQAMVAAGKADPARLIIRGGSAGGYTTLAALTFHQTFKAGASYYGISDLEVLQQDTHKFESRYNDSLIGPYPAARDIYIARSPIHFTDRLSCPIILFQGLEDKVVPPNQSAMMADAVREEGAEGEVRDLRGRAARLSQGREHHPRARRGARLLPGRVRRLTGTVPGTGSDPSSSSGSIGEGSDPSRRQVRGPER